MTQKKCNRATKRGKIAETRINTSFFWLQFSKKVQPKMQPTFGNCPMGSAKNVNYGILN